MKRTNKIAKKVPSAMAILMLSKYELTFYKNQRPFLLPAPFSWASFQSSHALCSFFILSSTCYLSSSLSCLLASRCSLRRFSRAIMLSYSSCPTSDSDIVGLLAFYCHTCATRSFLISLGAILFLGWFGHPGWCSVGANSGWCSVGAID